MNDIFISSDGGDLKLYNSQVEKAKNVLSVQLGSLEYAKELGVDLKYFLDENFVFQNESFKAHMIERLSANRIDVTQVLELVETLYSQYVFSIGNEPSAGLVQG